MDFPAALRRLRKAAGMTQEQLAAACGFASQSRIGNYESGRASPSLDDLATLARVLHVDVGAFFGQPSHAARLDREMIDDVISALRQATGRFHEGSVRDFVEYYELRAAMPRQPSTPRNTLELIARARSGTGDGRDPPLHVAGPAQAAGRKGKAKA